MLSESAQSVQKLPLQEVKEEGPEKQSSGSYFDINEDDISPNDAVSPTNIVRDDNV